ncbi:hypothetical protein EMCG_04317 [[Emmonsia] crescens]|uniref:Uncharacterized protein n=1 Tax=[Emmonsia] crescens TaxID=73230 RepID=A0A0G2HSR5_9EURO|nr:hypothetical protein EMCG_04317 [Emmonsia crescens UAMH 3008]
MSGNSRSIKFLPLPDDFEASAESATRAFCSKANFDIVSDFWRFDLPAECSPVVEEAKKLYMQERSLSEITDMTQHGVVLRRGFNVGLERDVIIIPLVAIDNATVITWKKVEMIPIDWSWKTAILISERTYFNVEEGKKIGGVLVQFKKRE